MARRALLVGIDHYKQLPDLRTCAADAVALERLLHAHYDGSRNFDCRLLVSTEGEITRQVLNKGWHDLFDDFDEDILFYFSGHGGSNASGGFLVTHDGTGDYPGLSTDELLTLANNSDARTVLLILDSCHAGELGDPAALRGQGGALQRALLRDGVTILAASTAQGKAREGAAHGVFTSLILGALSGGAADVRGRVSAAAIYAYAEQALNAWDQRPLYKTYGDRLPPVRLCKPMVADRLLRTLPAIFATPDSQRFLDETYEHTSPGAKPGNVALFNNFKTLRNAGLLRTQSGRDLFYITQSKGWVCLTPLGQFYWLLARQGQLGSVPHP
jgi:hypothetical protein